ncbi:MAG: DUF177 domain-containing protein [Lachnospiraceae bacterium]
MLVNLSDVFLTEEKIVSQSYAFPLDVVQNGLECFDILEKSDVALTCTHMSKGKVLVEALGYVILDVNCDRCLKPVPTRVDLSVHRVVYAPGVAIGEDEEDNSSIMEAYYLNLESLVFNEILMNWPVKVLCQTGCKGFCTVCGHNLNEGDCGCDTFVPDPRMAVIKDIFIANKEV